jgi:formylglycine-generating enzyme required for sulfatase activity
MLGNIFEWTSGEHDPRGYGAGRLVDPGGTLTTPEGIQRTARGGIAEASSGACSASFRLPYFPRSRGGGLRLARTVTSHARE